MSIMYVLGKYSEEESVYLGMNDHGEVFLTTNLYHALLHDKPYPNTPPGFSYLPFYMPNVEN